jgi:hypothetical protein
MKKWSHNGIRVKAFTRERTFEVSVPDRRLTASELNALRHMLEDAYLYRPPEPKEISNGMELVEIREREYRHHAA